MGFSAQVQQGQTGGNGKGSSQDFEPIQEVSQQTPQPMGKGGAQTNSATSGQPIMGAPNQYANTIGVEDNTEIQPQQPQSGGKGKG
jgi:hypothetical protein